MKQIKEIVESIHEELEGAEGYAKMATLYKDSDRSLSETYATIASQELSHVDSLHAQVVRLIKAQQSAGREAPASMQAVWNWEHGRMVDHVAKIKLLLEQYRK